MSAGASLRPSVNERCERACEVRVSTDAVRVVGTGGSLAGIWGMTVLCGIELAVEVVVGAGLATVEVAGFTTVEDAGVDDADGDVAAALGAVDVHAAWLREVDRPRCDIRCANGADLDCDEDSRAEKPLRTGVVAIVGGYSGWYGLRRRENNLIIASNARSRYA